MFYDTKISEGSSQNKYIQLAIILQCREAGHDLLARMWKLSMLISLEAKRLMSYQDSQYCNTNRCIRDFTVPYKSFDFVSDPVESGCSAVNRTFYRRVRGQKIVVCAQVSRAI